MAIRPFLPPTRTTNLLHIIFNTLRHIHMNDTLQVREIQSHTQSDCGYYYFDLSLSKFIESFSFLLIGKSRVVDSNAERSRVGYIVEHFVHYFTSARVNQDSLAFGNLLMVEVANQGITFRHPLLTTDCHVQIFI